MRTNAASISVCIVSVVLQLLGRKSESSSRTSRQSSSEIPWLSTPESIATEGYPVENNYITTSDGYILNIHRIPRGKTGRTNGKVVYLQHGSLSSSSDWIQYGPGNSLGYILADEGYDVWLGNTRGNTYSRNHTTLNPDTDPLFWDFTWHEMGTTDVPTIVDYILNRTGADDIYYIGHSQGSTVFFVMASTKPEYNKKIKTQISLAPVAFVGRLRSPLFRIMAALEKPVTNLLKRAGVYELLPNRGGLVSLAQLICPTRLRDVLCNTILYMIVGFSSEQMNITRVPLDHFPAGTSTKAVMHFVQEITSGKFCQYDYGDSGNLKKYGQISPPKYDLAKISAPVSLIYSENDLLDATEDVEELFEKLPNAKGKFLIPDRSWGHLDFLYGRDAPKFVYNEVIRILSEQ